MPVFPLVCSSILNKTRMIVPDSKNNNYRLVFLGTMMRFCIYRRSLEFNESASDDGNRNVTRRPNEKNLDNIRNQRDT